MSIQITTCHHGIDLRRESCALCDSKYGQRVLTADERAGLHRALMESARIVPDPRDARIAELTATVARLTGEVDRTCEWIEIEDGSGVFNTCKVGEEFHLDEGAEHWPYCHLCGGKIVIGQHDESHEMCSDCPPSNYPTDATRCAECPRRLPKPASADEGAAGKAVTSHNQESFS